MMTLEDRITEALAEEARSYRPSAELWDGVAARVEQPYWRRVPVRALAAAVAAVVLGTLLVWPGGGREGVRVGPAGAPDAAPTRTLPVPPPPRPLPSWAYPFLATKEGGRELFLVSESGTRALAGDPDGDVVYSPLGLAEGQAVFLRRRHEEVFHLELVIAPLEAGPEQTVDVTGASLSPDRTRIAYITREDRAPVDLVVRDVLGGNERRFSMAGSQFGPLPLLLVPRLVGDTVLLEYLAERSSPDEGLWGLDMRTAASARDAERWPAGVRNAVAFNDRQVVADDYRPIGEDAQRKVVLIDVQTKKVVGTPSYPARDFFFMASDGRGHLVTFGDEVQVYDGADWLTLPGYEFVAW